jgi:transposase
MEQNQTLQDFLNIPHTSREYKRALAVHMVESGMPPKDIARILDVSRAFISK